VWQWLSAFLHLKKSVKSSKLNSMNDLMQCFLVGVITGTGITLTVAIPCFMRLKSRIDRDAWWNRFWARRNERNFRVRL
jgi:hypothetical protein